MDLIPIHLYTPLYYHILLLVVIITFIHTQTNQSEDKLKISYFQWSGYALLGFVITYMGLRPINGVFVDMTTYASMFNVFKNGKSGLDVDDPVFSYYMQFTSKLISVDLFFFIDALLYIIPLYIVAKKWFNDYWFFAFLLVISSYSFWAYGVNGIRNGIAGSIALLGMSRDKRIFQFICLIVAIGIHKTMLLPALGFILASYFPKPKPFLLFWFLTIPLSILFSGFFESFFAALGFDDRLKYLTKAPDARLFSHIGFRWDFLIYGSTAVFLGWYYIHIKKFEDKVYTILYNTFLFANAFWILVNRANYSNRFAYLSWFMMAFVIIYPLLKQNLFVRQYRRIGITLLLYYSFTYIMTIILNK